MPDAELCWTPATALADAVRTGSIAPTEIATEFADRIETVNPQLNA
ncbi:MAG: aspartyl-tRNA(Asn)/glutamyl-tRNA(Gln) amidotransferase subunit, partial [Mycobacterium sp.]|nr:aspartyl-tRNA(Asn)/glutamyl-tRNA(Gln) amidotransferase subunit [Mycobacterium sp.]